MKTLLLSLTLLSSSMAFAAQEITSNGTSPGTLHKIVRSGVKYEKCMKKMEVDLLSSSEAQANNGLYSEADCSRKLIETALTNPDYKLLKRAVYSNLHRIQDTIANENCKLDGIKISDSKIKLEFKARKDGSGRTGVLTVDQFNTCMTELISKIDADTKNILEAYYLTTADANTSLGAPEIKL